MAGVALFQVCEFLGSADSRQCNALLSALASSELCCWPRITIQSDTRYVPRTTIRFLQVSDIFPSWSCSACIWNVTYACQTRYKADCSHTYFEYLFEPQHGRITPMCPWEKHYALGIVLNRPGSGAMSKTHACPKFGDFSMNYASWNIIDSLRHVLAAVWSSQPH